MNLIKNIVITEILLKLVMNGGYTNALLYDQLNVLQRAIGNYERSSITYFYTTSVPIFVKRSFYLSINTPQ